MSVLQYAAALSDSIDVRRLVHEMCRNRHEVLAQVDLHHIPTQCTGWLRGRIHFKGWGATWLLASGSEYAVHL